MDKKYELTEDTKIINGIKLHRIQALRSFGDVREGDVGGYIEKESNLSHYGNAWVFGNARVFGNAKVSEDACVRSDARVFGNARVFGDAWVTGNALVYSDAWVYGDAEVLGNAWVHGNARVYGNAWVFGDSGVFGNARVYGDAGVTGNALVTGNACVPGNLNKQAKARLTDKERKEHPVYSGLVKYFPDALMAIANHSHRGNEKHNPGTELHWDRSKSGDELDALCRHIIDEDWVAVAWRSLANLQKKLEGGYKCR